MMSHKSVSGAPMKRLTAGGQLRVFLYRENSKRADTLHGSPTLLWQKATPVIVGWSVGMFLEKQQ